MVKRTVRQRETPVHRKARSHRESQGIVSLLDRLDGDLGRVPAFLSQREREGAAKRRKGEGDLDTRTVSGPHPPMLRMGPSLSRWERG